MTSDPMGGAGRTGCMRRRVGSTNGTVCRMMCLSKTGYGFGQACIVLVPCSPLQGPCRTAQWLEHSVCSTAVRRRASRLSHGSGGAERHVRASSTIIVGKYS